MALPLSSRGVGAIEDAKRAAAERAADEVRSGQVVGLGTGSTAALFVEALGRRVAGAGLSILGVPTSRRTAELATSLRIPLIPIERAERVDLLVDGADRVDPSLAMVKGGGGALLWEKLVASVADRRIYVVDEGKQVPELGRDFPVPIEVVPAGLSIVSARLRRIGLDPVVRGPEGSPYTTDSGNLILDAFLPPGARIDEWERALTGMPGVVECGLFVGMVDLLLVGKPDGSVASVERPRRGSAAAARGEG